MPRFNHLALSVPPGELEGMRADLEKFYGGVLGAQLFDYDSGRLHYLIISFDEDFPSQSLVIGEDKNYMQSPGFDHIGLEYDTYAEVHDIIERCKEFKKGDDRMEIIELAELKDERFDSQAVYLRYLLPIMLDVQALKWHPGEAPKKQWEYR